MRPPARARARPSFLPRRGGFILLFGARTIVSNDAPPSAGGVEAVCPRCARRVGMLAKSYRTWFTIFFLPLFPISGRTRFTECPGCGAQFKLSPEELRSQIGAADAAANQQAIALYNSLRASPGNAMTLHQLMTTYAGMQEYDQAISSANQFRDALYSSEQCMAMLGRVFLAKNDPAQAVQWFDAAISRNPQYGEAHYYKAIAYLLATPPEPDKAAAAARAARGAGYPGAEDVLRDAEARARGER
jgi:tetratricopeptide (TPR) repeat protein